MELTLSKNQAQTVVNAIKAGLEVSSGAKAQATYYHKKEEQVQAVKEAVAKLYNIDKSLPILLSTMEGATYFFIQQTLLNEFKSGAPAGRSIIIKNDEWFDTIQDKAVRLALSKLPITYALRLFIEMAKNKVNGYRARRLALEYIWANMNEFTVLKYRNKFSRILRHMYGNGVYGKLVALADEVGTNFITNEEAAFWHDHVGKYSPAYEAAYFIQFIERVAKIDTNFPLLAKFFQLFAVTDETKWFNLTKELDKSVVIGVVTGSKSANPLFRQFYTAKGELTDDFKKKLAKSDKASTDEVKIRQTARNEALGVRTKVNTDNVTTEALYKTKGTQKAIKERVELDKLDLPYENALIIMDQSLSAQDKIDTQIRHMTDVLAASIPGFLIVHTGIGQTNYAKAFVNNVREDHDVVFIVGDGYENYPHEGMMNAIVEAMRNQGWGVPVIHINPMVSAEKGATGRTLGSHVTTLVANEPKNLAAQMNVKMIELNPMLFIEAAYKTLYDEIGQLA